MAFKAYFDCFPEHFLLIFRRRYFVLPGMLFISN